MITKKNINKVFIIFIITHLFLWTLIPSISNLNLPLDTIEALAWGSNLDWGYNKHPPLSAFAVEFFYKIFANNDWAYYFLSQIFVITAFYFVWKFSNQLFEDKTYSLLSVLILSGIYFYNFTTPEFNVNISQLPFWALSVYFFWKGLQLNKRIDWILFGIFSAVGFLSKYLFVYILFSLFIFFLFNYKKYKQSVKNYCLSILVSLVLLTPHFVWLFDNNFVTILYGLNRSGISEFNVLSHIKFPLLFLFKQVVILIPFFVMIFIIIKKSKFKINFKDKKILFFLSINLIPIFLMLTTSILTGANIRTMWMTPFYLFFGVLFVYIFQSQINLKKIRSFLCAFLFLFILSPSIYSYVSISEKNKRTDYPGREIAELVERRWNKNFSNEIKYVVGDEWHAGNLSYHISTRPIWFSSIKGKADKLDKEGGVVYTGNADVLKQVCPGIYGKIRKQGFCMIGN